MPIHDFECSWCGHREERVLRISEADQTQRCTQQVRVSFQETYACNGEMTKSWDGKAPGVQFKGRGWTPRHYGQKGRR